MEENMIMNTETEATTGKGLLAIGLGIVLAGATAAGSYFGYKKVKALKESKTEESGVIEA